MEFMGVFGVGDELGEGIGIEFAEAFAVGEEPVVVTGGEEVAAIERDGGFEVCGVGGGGGGRIGTGNEFEELGNVDDGRGIGAPFEGLGVCGEKEVGVGQSVAKAMDEVAEVGVGLFFGRILPEEEGKMFAGLWDAAVEEEKGEQGLEARGIKAVERLPKPTNLKIPQELELQSRHARSPCPAKHTRSTAGKRAGRSRRMHWYSVRVRFRRALYARTRIKGDEFKK
jgi:hypothetical protein